jgi:hypothetical protein
MTLLAHWPLNDNAASTTVVATVGTNGTLNGGDKTLAGPGGSITAGLQMNGTDDYIDVASTGLVFASGDVWSVSWWAKRGDGVEQRWIGGTSFSWIKGNGGGSVQYTSGGGGSKNYTTPSQGTAWHHFLMTHDASNNVRLWMDGTESSAGTQNQAGGYWAEQIGVVGGDQFSNAAFAQVKVFNSEESGNVATLYAEGSGGGGPNIPAIANYYRRMRAG